MTGQTRQQRQRRGIPDAAIEGAEHANRTLDPDSLTQPGPGLSDVARESNPSAEKRNPDVEKFHDGSDAGDTSVEESDEWEVMEE